MNILNKWFIIDLVKLLSRAGVVIIISATTVIIQFVKPAYGFIDILLILAVGMILGATYTTVQKRASEYLDEQSKPKHIK